jgi:predicted AAA+ superfamily ATPase
VYNIRVGYKKRLIDEKLANRENLSIGIVITGVRGCGKTETSKQFIKSEFIVDDKEETKLALEINPNVVLEGEKPRLIDEWQLEKWIWNKVRHAVDNKEGCFILTGSATPVEDDTMHTGANRFIFLHMRPMS